MFITIVGIFEILFVNLYHTHLLSKKKYPNYVTFLVLLGFTAVLFLIIYLVGIKEGTTIRSIFVGALYVFPLYLLYETKLKKLAIIMIYCWTYTFAIITISYGIANLLSTGSMLLWDLILRTVILVISFPFIFKFSKKEFKTILDKSSARTQNLLFVLGVSIFSSFVGIRYYVDTSTALLLILSVIICIIALTSYSAFYTITESGMRLKSASKLALMDALTGINNRYSLLNDMETMINQKTNFDLFFMDLDNLKEINDRFTHKEGDNYLKEFASILSKLIENKGRIYRFAGDEFIALLPSKDHRFDIQAFKQEIHAEMNKKFEFYGVSIGQANFPKDGLTADEIINKADQSMYEEKHISST